MSRHCFDDEPKSIASSVAGNTEPPKVAPALTTSEPPVIAPVVVIVDEPVSILPKPLVIDPLSKAPVVTRLELPAVGLNVTEPPRATADPLIVMLELANAELGTELSLEFGNVPVDRLDALVVSTTAKVLSPLKNVVLSLVPEDPSLATGTVPETRLEAFILAS